MSARTRVVSVLAVAALLTGCASAPGRYNPSSTTGSDQLTEADATYAKNAYAVYLATSDGLYTDQTLPYEQLKPLVSAELFDDFVAELEQFREEGSHTSGASHIVDIEAASLDESRVEVTGCIDASGVTVDESGLRIVTRGGTHGFVAVLERTDDWFIAVSDERIAAEC